MGNVAESAIQQHCPGILSCFDGAAAGPPPPRFATLHDAFNWCQPNASGLITGKVRFKQVAFALASERGEINGVWKQLDQDGNGAVSFPEFVEWAESKDIALPAGVDGGGFGERFPPTWKGSRNDRKWDRRVAVTDGALLKELQDLLRVTYKNVYTRDRKKTGRDAVPTSFELKTAEARENYHDWRGYYLKRWAVEQKTKGSADFVKYRCLAAEAKELCGARHRLHGYSNEFLLFHGTTAKSLPALCSGDFTMHLAGSATGTLYGRGLYFAESITKADEYSEEGPDGICAVLVCRVLGGKVLYSDALSPDAASLQHRVLESGYHCILGDREKAKKTFKEYIVFDADQVYIEYVLFYRRCY